MAIQIDKKVYRNITEQVAKNTSDIGKYNTEFNSINERLDEINDKIDELDIDAVVERLDAVEQTANGANETANNAIGAVSTLSDELDRDNDRISALENNVRLINNRRWFIHYMYVVIDLGNDEELKLELQIVNHRSTPYDMSEWEEYLFNQRFNISTSLLIDRSISPIDYWNNPTVRLYEDWTPQRNKTIELHYNNNKVIITEFSVTIQYDVVMD